MSLFKCVYVCVCACLCVCVCMRVCVCPEQDQAGRKRSADVSVRPLDSTAEQVTDLHSLSFHFTLSFHLSLFLQFRTTAHTAADSFGQ